MYCSRIVGTGAYVPAKVLTNADLEVMVETSDEWITTRTGISERRIAAENEATSDLAVAATFPALTAAGLDPMDVDLILVATVTPDMLFPSTACVVQDKIGAKRAAAFDISAACAGFVYGLAVADGLLRSGIYRHILLIGAETLSKVLDWTDRNTCVLFGDGAGAVLLQRSTGEPGVLSTHLYSDGTKWDQLLIPGGGSRYPLSADVLAQNLHKIKMTSGNEVFKIAVRSLEDAALTALKQNGREISEIDLFVPHQANYRIIHAVGQRLGLPDEKVYMNLNRYGNTSAASIPLALDEAVRTERLKEGDLLLFAAFGGGFAWGSSLVRW